MHRPRIRGLAALADVRLRAIHEPEIVKVITFKILEILSVFILKVLHY